MKSSYYLPAEWMPHQGTWLTYPQNTESFCISLEKARETVCDMIDWISCGEKVHINVNGENVAADLNRRLKSRSITENVITHHFKTDDSWCRDNGAIFLKDHNSTHLAATTWVFNAWGDKFEHAWDAKLPTLMAQSIGAAIFPFEMVLEGGAIEPNGAGTLLTTTPCLLNPNRNPGLSKEEIEAQLCAAFGAKQILWLDRALVGDDTDGHIDNLARFVSADTIMTAIEIDPHDANYEALKENRLKLAGFKGLDGRPFNIIDLPMPAAQFLNGERLPASYLNFYICNNAVIVPTFDCPQDQAAIDALQKAFPKKRVVGISAQYILTGGGAFHCLTQPVPISTSQVDVGREQ